MTEISKETKETNFETAFQKLEAAVARLEEEDLSLEEALRAYETGVKMAEICSKRLSEAERKVEVLMKTNAGRFKTAPLETDSAAGNKPSKKKNC